MENVVAFQHFVISEKGWSSRNPIASLSCRSKSSPAASWWA